MPTPEELDDELLELEELVLPELDELEDELLELDELLLPELELDEEVLLPEEELLELLLLELLLLELLLVELLLDELELELDKEMSSSGIGALLQAVKAITKAAARRILRMREVSSTNRDEVKNAIKPPLHLLRSSQHSLHWHQLHYFYCQHYGEKCLPLQYPQSIDARF